MLFDFIRRQHRREFRAGAKEEIVGLLEPGIEIEGLIKVDSGLIRMNCQIKGAISSTGTVIVASQAEIEADIDAMEISIAGKVRGNIHASKQLEIREHGILLGDVETPSLIVDPGAYFTGHCDMPTHQPEESLEDEVAFDRERA